VKKKFAKSTWAMVWPGSYLGEAAMGCKLYIGNLSFTATEDELKEYFAQAGTPESVAIIKDRLTGKSRGFGFVEMSSDSEAAQAIEQLDGKDFKGRPLKINEARAREGGGAGRAGDHPSGAGRH
jgi:RNA recognition motif-containing protein